MWVRLQHLHNKILFDLQIFFTPLKNIQSKKEQSFQDQCNKKLHSLKLAVRTCQEAIRKRKHPFFQVRNASFSEGFFHPRTIPLTQDIKDLNSVASNASSTEAVVTNSSGKESHHLHFLGCSNGTKMIHFNLGGLSWKPGSQKKYSFWWVKWYR